MPITDSQKVDYLFKKIGYSVAKTDMANVKSPSNESIASPLAVRGGSIWTQSDVIPNTIPVSNSSVVALYNDALTSTVQTVNDGTASTNRTWKTNLTDWIDASFGSTYQVKVYLATTGNAAPQTYGTQLFADGSGSSDEWFFDYAAGVLNFIGNALPSGSFTGKSIFISGARYVGSKGLGNLGNVSFNGNISADEIYEAGYRVLTANSNISINGSVVGYGNASNIYVTLTSTGVTPGTYGAADDEYTDKIPKITVDADGRITNISNVTLTQVSNISFNNTNIYSNSDVTITSLNNANIYLNATGTGVVQFSGGDAMWLPTGDTSTRPVNPEIGYFRFNTDNDIIEYWDGNDWASPGVQPISSQVLTPDGVGNSFVLSDTATPESLLVMINGTLQQPLVSYDVTGNVITFSEVPLTSDVIEVRRIASGATTVSGLALGPTSVNLTTGNVNIAGNLVPTANVTYDLGGPNNWWRDLYLSGNSIYLGGLAITNNNGILTSTVDGNLTTLQANDPTDLQDVVTLGYLQTQLNSIDSTIIQSDDTSVTIIDDGVDAGNIIVAVDGANVAKVGADKIDLYRNAVITGNVSANVFTYANGQNILDSVISNAAVQAGAIANVSTAITTANTAMKGYVDSQITSNISALVNGAPSTLDTLNELATALGNDANLSVSLTSMIGNVQSNVTTSNTAMKGYVDSQITSVTSAWQSNAGSQAGSLATLTSNAAVQAGNIATIFANLGAVSGSIATLTANAGSQSGSIATLQSATNGVVPIGGIIMWSGNIATIPTNWALCNGSNGTPDLRDRFIIGASADSGGQANTTISGTTTKTGGSKDAITVSHSHTANSTFTGSQLGNHGHTATTDTHNGHSHTAFGIAGGGGSYLAGSGGRDPGTVTSNVSGVHSHSVTVVAASAGTPSGTVATSVDSAGSSGTNANLPPYYALAFIMRIS